MHRTGRSWSDWPSRPRRSAFISPRTRWMPMRPALRRLGVVPMRAGRDATRPGGRHAGEARRNVWSIQGAHPTRTGSRMAWVRLSDAVGRLRGDAVQRSARPVACSVGRGHQRCWSPPIYGSRARRCASPRRTWPRWIRLRQAPVRRCASGCAETASVPHIRDAAGAGRHGQRRVVLVPMLDGARQVEIALPGGFKVTPRLAEALLASPGVQRVEEI